MALRFVLDEHFRGSLWDIIQRHNLFEADKIDAVRIGDSTDLPLGIPDPQILIWAERQSRILISADKSTMARHLAAGHHCPGVMTPKRNITLPQLLDFLLLAAHASEPDEWENQVVFVP